MRQFLKTLGLVAVLCGVPRSGFAQGPHTASEPAEVTLDSTVQPLNLNLATEEQLLELPGIGPARARAILAFRQEHGGFQSVSQLLRVKGFGRATLRRLRPLLVVPGIR